MTLVFMYVYFLLAIVFRPFFEGYTTIRKWNRGGNGSKFRGATLNPVRFLKLYESFYQNDAFWVIRIYAHAHR